MKFTKPNCQSMRGAGSDVSIIARAEIIKRVVVSKAAFRSTGAAGRSAAQVSERWRLAAPLDACRSRMPDRRMVFTLTRSPH
jgi:hypothetical protein